MEVVWPERKRKGVGFLVVGGPGPARRATAKAVRGISGEVPVTEQQRKSLGLRSERGEEALNIWRLALLSDAPMACTPYRCVTRLGAPVSEGRQRVQGRVPARRLAALGQITAGSCSVANATPAVWLLSLCDQKVATSGPQRSIRALPTSPCVSWMARKSC